MAVVQTLPNNYLLKKSEYVYPMLDGVSTSFFLNTDDPVTSPAIGNIRLSVFDAYGTEVISDVQTVQITTNDRLYVEDMVISGLVYNREYRLVMYNTTNDEVIFLLNCFRFVPVSDQYVEVSYRNSTDILNFDYEEIPNFRNVIYLDLNVIDEQSEVESESYLEANTNLVRNQKTEFRYFVIIESFFFDRVAHQGMQGLMIHDDILLNGRPYQRKENYTTEPNIRNNKFKGTAEFWDQDLNALNAHS